MAEKKFFRQIRIFILLFLLLLVGGDAWLTKIRTTDWNEPLYVTIFPINGDQSEVSAQYIKQLSVDIFQDIAVFMQEEASHYHLSLTNPINLSLADELQDHPPKLAQDANVLAVVWWSLKMRYWVWQIKRHHSPPADIHMFVLFYDPDQNQRLAHSLGLEKGLIGVVNAFAAREFAAKNNIVVAHELLHTVGATDKYELASGNPLYPQGYVEPKREPLYPQEFAEIMAGATPITQNTHIMPEALTDIIIGVETAKEIHWME